MQNRAVAIVVAGGESRRMSDYGDKLRLPVEPGGIPILGHVIETARVIADEVHVAYGSDETRTEVASWLSNTGPTVVWHRDQVTFRGPLQALSDVFATIDLVATQNVFVLAGDLPGLRIPVLQQLQQQLLHADVRVDGAVAVRADKLQPLVAVYRPSVATILQKLAIAGEQRLMKLLRECRVIPLSLGEEEWQIRPVHTPQDYDAWLRWRGEFEES